MLKLGAKGAQQKIARWSPRPATIHRSRTPPSALHSWHRRSFSLVPAALQ